MVKQIMRKTLERKYKNFGEKNYKKMCVFVCMSLDSRENIIRCDISVQGSK